MRFVNHGNRLTLVTSPPSDDLAGASGIDVHEASGGQLPAEPERALACWDDVLEWARTQSATADVEITIARLGPPSPRPRQMFGIGINYADHVAEANMEIPKVPLVFLKLSTAVAGPFDAIPLSTDAVDWEVEVAVVIGRPARNVSEDQGWEPVAGVTGGQDLSDRAIQWQSDSTPQFGLGKSLAGFAPLGPALVTPDEYDDPDDIELSCRLNGEEVQHSTSAQLLISVPRIVSFLSGVVTLQPGDVIFTGTPGGVGMTRTPPRYLSPGDTLESFVAGVGTMRHTFVAVPAAQTAGH
jgi:2,4-didehydro-3-deoxy-L-rhamnonate hydrolase